jgi:hypothetical protein
MAERKIMEELELIKGWAVKLYEFNPILSSKVIKTDITRPFINRHSQYFLEARIGVEFWANDAQLIDGIKMAKKTFARRIYSDIRSFVLEIMQDISNSDKERAMKHCQDILNYTDPE